MNSRDTLVTSDGHLPREPASPEGEGYRLGIGPELNQSSVHFQHTPTHPNVPFSSENINTCMT